MHSKKTAAMAVVATMASVVALAAPADAATKAKLTGAPHSGLKNGSKVKLVGTHFPKSSTIFVVECAGAKVTKQAQCDTAHLTMVKSSKAGSFSVKYAVRTGKIGNGTCKHGKTCSLVASTGSGSGGTLKITFK